MLRFRGNVPFILKLALICMMLECWQPLPLSAPNLTAAEHVRFCDLAWQHLFWFEKVQLLTLKCRHPHLLGASSPGTDGVSAGKNILKMPLLLDKSMILSLWKTYYRTSQIDYKGDSEMSGILFIFCYL